MFANTELYILFVIVIFLYFVFIKIKNVETNPDINFLTFLVLIVVLGMSIMFFVTKPEEDRLTLNPGDTYVKKFYAGFTSAVKIYVRPLEGSCTVDLLYGYDKTDEKVSQCKWVSLSSDTQTNSFINDALGSYYELRITSSQKTKVLISVTKANDMNVYHTPHNAIIAPINSSHTRINEIVPEGSTYTNGQKSSVFDFGSSNATNIEINAFCSSSSSPKMSLFGSDVNDTSKFIRITEFSFGDGGFSNINSKFYIDQVAMTSNRYFYIEISEATASNLYVKITRRNF
jgi:hypothetical protein